MKGLKERIKEIKVPVLTINDYVRIMKAYDNTFSEKFYTLLFILEDYIEQTAGKFGLKFHPSIRQAQRFVQLIKSHLHCANFQQAIIIVYVKHIFAGEDTYPEFFEQHLKEATGFDIIMKHLYDTYLEDCAGSEKKEEEKKDMKETKNTTEESTFFREFYNGLSPETKQILKGLVLHESEHSIFSEKGEEEISMVEINFAEPGCLKALQKMAENIKTPKNGLPTVSRVCINKDTNMTMLQFSNGDSISVYRDPEDQEDLEKAIAIAMVKYAWGYLENEKAMKRVVNATKKPKNKKKPGELKPAFLAPHDELKKKKIARRKPVEEAPKDETPKKTTHRKPGPKKPKLQDILDHLVESEH